MEIDEREIRSELLSPAGRVVMLSGGSTGIGAAIARRLIVDGYSVSLGGRRPREIEGEIRRLREFAACGSVRCARARLGGSLAEGDAGQVRPPRRADQQRRANCAR